MIEILDHTADIGFRACGADLKEMFANAALALVSIAVEVEDVEPKHVYPIAASGEDLESTLVNWLSEVLYLLDGTRIAFCKFEVDEVSGTQVIGRGYGEPREADHPRPKIVVKGVTYHQLKIYQEADGRWCCQVFLDI